MDYNKAIENIEYLYNTSCGFSGVAGEKRIIHRTEMFINEHWHFVEIERINNRNVVTKFIRKDKLIRKQKLEKINDELYTK